MWINLAEAEANCDNENISLQNFAEILEQALGDAGRDFKSIWFSSPGVKASSWHLHFLAATAEEPRIQGTEAVVQGHITSRWDLQSPLGSQYLGWWKTVVLESDSLSSDAGSGTY